MIGGAAALLAVSLLTLACGSGDGEPVGVSATTTTQAKLTGNITVLAAASLTEAFTEAGMAFEGANPGTRVAFSFASSSTLATQANQGAPADLFASADETNMKKVTDTGGAADPTIFVRNRLAVLVGKNNPRGIGAVKNLDRPDITFVLCAIEVPCGKFGQQILDKAGVTAKPKSFEENVKAVVTKVTLGEVDAGLVYVTDAKAAGDSAASVDIPDELNVIAAYPLAVLKQAGKPDVAGAFKAFVLSPAGQGILGRYGFMRVS